MPRYFWGEGRETETDKEKRKIKKVREKKIQKLLIWLSLFGYFLGSRFTVHISYSCDPFKITAQVYILLPHLALISIPGRL